MLKRRFVISLMLVATRWLCAQERTPEFTGTWQGSFQGAVFCVLAIDRAGDSISGTLSPGNVTVDENGEITEAQPSSAEGRFPLRNAHADGPVLTFDWKEESDDQSLRFQFKITGTDEGELSLLNVDHIKPIRLQRAR